MGNVCEAKKSRTSSSVHAITQELWNIFKIPENYFSIRNKVNISFLIYVIICRFKMSSRKRACKCIGVYTCIYIRVTRILMSNDTADKFTGRAKCDAILRVAFCAQLSSICGTILCMNMFNSYKFLILLYISKYVFVCRVYTPNIIK